MPCHDILCLDMRQADQAITREKTPIPTMGVESMTETLTNDGLKVSDDTVNAILDAPRPVC